ncbi:MAG: copper-binding protein [Burkholderiaceae bacterium]
MNRFTRLLSSAAVAGSLFAIGSAQAHDTHEAPGASAPMEMSHGEVRTVDKDSARLTIRHGELKNLGMPAMTMVFRVKDPSMLGQVKPGDTIDFMAEKVNGALTVTMLQAAH